MTVTRYSIPGKAVGRCKATAEKPASSDCRCGVGVLLSRSLPDFPGSLADLPLTQLSCAGRQPHSLYFTDDLNLPKPHLVDTSNFYLQPLVKTA